MDIIKHKRNWKSRLPRAFVVLLVSVGIVAAVVIYGLLSASSNIFSSGKENQAATAKEFMRMIASPSAILKGESRDQINILLLGIGGGNHGGGQLTDTVMVLSIKPRQRQAALLSIPRDLYVEVQGTDIKTKINAVKELGDLRGEGQGIAYLESTVGDITGLSIDYYAQMDFEGFIRFIDALGGIDIYLKNDIDDKSYPDFNYGYDPFYIEKGWHHLDGSTALKVARSRHGSSDFERIGRQQDVIVAARGKLYEKFSSFDILAFSETLSSLSDNLQTDIGLAELPRFYQIMRSIKTDNFTSSLVDPQKYLTKINVGLGYTLGTKSGDYSATSELAESIFDFTLTEKQAQRIKAESALIAIENGSGSPDLANTVAQNLEDLGLRVVSTTNISDPSWSGAILRHRLDLDISKPETFALLKDKFGAKTEADNAITRAEFVVALGKGY